MGPSSIPYLYTLFWDNLERFGGAGRTHKILFALRPIYIIKIKRENKTRVSADHRAAITASMYRYRSIKIESVNVSVRSEGYKNDLVFRFRSRFLSQHGYLLRIIIIVRRQNETDEIFYANIIIIG